MTDDAIYLDQASPEVYAALVTAAKAVSAAAEQAGLDHGLVELVNLRVSQINGCAFCLDVHHRKAVRAGVEERTIAVLPAWRETELFDERQRAALAFAESITYLGDHDRRVAVEQHARAVLGDEAFAAVAWIAISINAFNRISITSHHPVR